MLTGEIRGQVDAIWNAFWTGRISNPLEVIEQITYLLFMKRLDELDQKRIADAKFTGEKYTSKFSGDFIVPGSKAKEKIPITWMQIKH